MLCLSFFFISLYLVSQIILRLFNIERERCDNYRPAYIKLPNLIVFHQSWFVYVLSLLLLLLWVFLCVFSQSKTYIWLRISLKAVFRFTRSYISSIAFRTWATNWIKHNIQYGPYVFTLFCFISLLHLVFRWCIMGMWQCITLHDVIISTKRPTYMIRLLSLSFLWVLH